jgi:NADH dehydrogenase
LGGGISGLRVAVALSNRLSKLAVTLVDQRERHELPHALFRTTQSHYQGVLAFRSLAERFSFVYVRGVIRRVNLREQTVVLADRRLSYDYMVSALGSSSVVPSEYALPVSTSVDIERIKQAITFAFQQHRHAVSSRPITIAVVGGGLAGVVVVGQLMPVIHALALEFGIAATRVRVVCYERLGRLLPAYGHAVGRTAERYLSELGVQVQCHTNITQVEQSRVVYEDGEGAPIDIVVWAGGWRAQHIAVEGGVLPLGARGQVLVNNKFQIHTFPNVFCVGDQASPPFPHRHGTVQETLAESEYVASILPRIMQNMRVAGYTPKHHTEYVPLGTGDALQVREHSASTGWLARVGLRRVSRKYQTLLGI